MPIYRASYSLGETDFVEASSHYWATKTARVLHPAWKLIEVAVAKEMKGVRFTDWNKLVLGGSVVQCALCGVDVYPGHVFSQAKAVEDRPCHDAAENVFCKVSCREEFVTTYGGSVRLVEAYDYDTWASIRVPVPAEDDRRKEWEGEWTLIDFNGDKPVLIATHRYQSMMRYQPHVEFTQEAQ